MIYWAIRQTFRKSYEDSAKQDFLPEILRNL